MSQMGRFSAGSGAMPVETLTGNTGGPVPPTGGNINVVGDTTTIIVAGNPGTSTLTISATGEIAASFPTDNGTAIPAFNDLNVLGGVTSPEVVSNINTYADPDLSNNLRIALNNTIYWPSTDTLGTQGVLYINSNRFLHRYTAIPGTENCFVGNNAGNFTCTNTSNVGIGTSALRNLTDGDSLTAVGGGALFSVTTGDNCVAIGSSALNNLTTGHLNDAIGANVGFDGTNGLVNGSYNIIIGGGETGFPSAGSAYTAGESSNILLRNTGVNGENNTIRIGIDGIGSGQQNRCFIAGISGINVGSVANVVSIDTATGQLGSTAITAGSNITVTPGANTITISASSNSSYAYTNVNTTPYVVLSTDVYISVDSSGAPITIQLPNAATSGRFYIIKDRTGSANTNNITVTTVGGAVNIDGATTYVMNTQYASIQIMGNGSTYEIF